MGRTNLPVQVTSFIGRERELDEIVRLLSTSRLLTLIGPGGCGKTRLALHAAGLVGDRYLDGVWLVELASLRDPALLPQLIAKSLGISHAPEQPAREALLQHVQSRQMLLLLDNCEHLIAECARLAQQLLAQAPHLRLVATSREPLAIAGETQFPLSGLEAPAASVDQAVDDPETLMQYDAVRLLVDRVRTVLPNFTLTPVNIASVVQICRRLDGLPLALELASARSNVLTLQQIAERLDDRFSLLVSRQRTAPDPRHHTLRATMDWSYELLSGPEQVLLRRLSVFAGGCSLAAVSAVCSGDAIAGGEIIELLQCLVSKSLVVAHTLQRSDARYDLLETIRQYAHEKLAASGEGPALRDRHLQWFREATVQAAPKLSGPYQQLWLGWLEAEHDNVRAALTWSLERRHIEAGLRIANALYQYWTVRDYAAEGLAWFERLIAAAHPDEIGLALRAEALAHASFLARFRGEPSAATPYGREVAALVEAASDQDKRVQVLALVARAHAAGAARDDQAEYALARQVLQLSRESGDPQLSGVALSTYFHSALSLGKYADAHAVVNESLPLLRAVADPYVVALTINAAGDLARCERNYAQAQSAYEESIAILRELGAVRDLASVLHNLGHTCLHLDNAERARALFHESLELYLPLKHTPGIAECLMGFAALAVLQELPAAGARLLAAAEALGGRHITSAWAATRLEHDHYQALICARLTEPEFLAEQAAGRALSLEQAVAYAQVVAGKAAALTTAQKKLDALSEREREVALLIAQGKSNTEIAQALVLSRRTVESHVASIPSKLDYANRTQVARWAIDSGLIKSSV